MDFKFLSNRVKNIILDPVKAWEAIYTENGPVKDVRDSFFFPIVLIAALSAFFGSLLFTNTELSWVYNVLTGIKYFVLLSVVIYVTAVAFKEIAVRFNLKCDYASSFKIIVYSSAPFLLCQIISRLFESFIFVNILALYGLYIFWTGAEKILNPPEQKKLPLMIAATAVYIFTFIITNWLLSKIVDGLYFSIFA